MKVHVLIYYDDENGTRIMVYKNYHKAFNYAQSIMNREDYEQDADWKRFLDSTWQSIDGHSLTIQTETVC